jgi:hypothetical protein
MATVAGTAVVGAVVALSVILVAKFVAWTYDLYASIFRPGGREKWDRWNLFQRILFILFIPLLLIVVPLMVGFQILVLIAALYLGVAIVRGVLHLISH